MANHVVVTVITIFLAVFFFSVPLVLKYRVLRSEQESVASGDSAPLRLQRVSRTWCQAVELQSDSSFRSFLFESEPQVMPHEQERTVSRLQVQLKSGQHEYWGLHLLEGSSVRLSGCSLLPTAGVTLLKGKEALDECLTEHMIRLRHQQESEEDSLSDSESDQGTSSISSSQGAVGNDSIHLHACAAAMQHARLVSSYACQASAKEEHQGDREQPLDFMLEVTETGYYYFLLSSQAYLNIVANHLSLHFTIDRSQYDWSSSSSNCSKGRACRLSLPMRSTGRHVVVQTAVLNGSELQEHVLKVSCRPREGLFLLFYAAFLIVIFLSAFH